MRDGGERITALDGLRAVAALVVVFTHATGAIRKHPLVAASLYESPLVVFLNATGAVHIFFVLSGLCLAASASRCGDARDVAQFYVRRFARVQAPFVAVALLAWCGSLYYAIPESETGRSGLSVWVMNRLQVDISLAALLPTLRFPGDAHGLMPQGWTLRVEMIYSLLLPFLVMAARRFGWGLLIAVAVPLLFEQRPMRPEPYLLDFGAGIALYLERERLERLFAELPRFASAALGLGGLVIVCLPAYFFFESSHPPLANACFATGATLLVACAAHAPGLRRWLSARPCAALGRISYSIYMLHFSVILLSAPLLASPVGPAFAVAYVAFVAIATCALAASTYRWVEVPCIRAGNLVSGLLARLTGGQRRDSTALPPPAA